MAIKFVNDKARKTFESYIQAADLGLPTSCPECGADVEVQENGQVRCINPNCKKKVLHKYINFFKTLEIDSAGEAFCSAAASEGNTIKFLIDKGLADPDAYVRFAGGINGNKVAASLKAKFSEPISAAKFISLFDLEGFGEKKLDKVEDVLLRILDGKDVLVKDLASKEGIMCGISSGTNVAAALKLAKKLGKGKTVVAVLPDTAERYFSTPLFDE